MTSSRAKDPDSTSEWAATKERGSSTLLGIVVWCIHKLGVVPLRPLVVPIALYYCIFDGRARRASQAYLLRVGVYDENDGRRARLIHTYRHFRSFAEVILDRLAIWGGSHDDFAITIHGKRTVLDLVEKNRGGFMVSAHLGSFDVMRVIAREADIPVNVLIFTANAPQINAAFAALDPRARVRLIEVDPQSTFFPSTVLEIRRRIEAGEFVATMGDRAQPGTRSRVAEVDFLGGRARFPESIFLLAMIIGAPVLLAAALRTGSQSYEVFFETLADGQKVARNERQEHVDEQLQAFAHRLEFLCRKAPHQWFNFYDFWRPAER